MKITALIVDDEQPARDELAFLLKSFPDVEVVGQGKNGVEAVSMVRELNPHLVFLDVQMPGVDGFGVIKRLLEKKARLPFFIFATAYDQYAVQAFEVNAIDYLLKPVAKPRLEKALLRVRRLLETSDATSQKLDRLVQMVEQRPVAQKGKLVVKSANRLFLVDSDDVVYASIEDGVISIVTRELEGQSNFRTVEELQANLDPQGLLARASLLPGQRESHQGSGPLVQELLPAQNGRSQADGNPRQPCPNPQTARVAEPLKVCRDTLECFQSCPRKCVRAWPCRAIS